MKSRFAAQEEIFSHDFENINGKLLDINNAYGLVDHNHLNKARFLWWDRIKNSSAFYGSRFWEYPFAIISAELKAGMKCADIGCGSTPFTPFLCELVGKTNVFGFDKDFIQDDSTESHYSFGARESVINKAGFQFYQTSFTKTDFNDNYFDRIFCISVLEHIEDPKIKGDGIMEMVRILKPGGRLIITFDLGINNPLNSPLKIIEISGLLPFGELDLKWPKERFVNYGNSNVDVFGLVLTKKSGEINLDYRGLEKIYQYEAYNKYSQLSNWFNVNYGDILLINDLKKRYGLLRVLIKYLLNKY